MMRLAEVVWMVDLARLGQGSQWAKSECMDGWIQFPGEESLWHGTLVLLKVRVSY